MKSREEIVEIVKGFLIEDIEIDEELLTDDALLKQGLGIDSLDFIDIVVIVEKKFGFKIKTEEMQNVTTLSQFYDYIESKQKRVLQIQPNGRVRQVAVKSDRDC